MYVMRTPRPSLSMNATTSNATSSYFLISISRVKLCCNHSPGPTVFPRPRNTILDSISLFQRCAVLITPQSLAGSRAEAATTATAGRSVNRNPGQGARPVSLLVNKVFGHLMDVRSPCWAVVAIDGDSNAREGNRNLVTMKRSKRMRARVS